MRPQKARRFLRALYAMKHIKYVIFLILACGGLLLSLASNASLCMWGCPETLFAYTLKASFYLFFGLIFLVLYFWVKNTKSKSSNEEC